MWKEIVLISVLCILQFSSGDDLCVECVCGESDEKAGFLTASCQKNGLTSVPEVSIWPENIYTLEVSRNNITTLETLERYDSIRIFKIRYCGLKSIAPKVFTAYLLLEHLDISQNELKDLKTDTFFGLGSLTVLNLSNNNIKKLPDDIFDSLVKLQELRLSDNPIKYLEARIFQRLDHLISLDISNIDAPNLANNVFHPMEKLKILDLSRNKFKKVPDIALQSAPSLETLYFNENRVTVIDENSFQDLKQLKVLTMTDMPNLSVIKERAFSALTSLEVLNISNSHFLNHINSFAFDGIYNPADIDTLRLKTLILSNNALSTLDAYILPWCQIQILDLQGNPWYCDCSMKWIINCSFPAELSTNLKCHDPKKHARKFLKQLAEEEFICTHLLSPSPESEVRTIAAVMGITLTLAVFVVVVLFMNRRRIKAWWTFRRRGQGAVYYVKAHTNPTDNGEL